MTKEIIYIKKIKENENRGYSTPIIMIIIIICLLLIGLIYIPMTANSISAKGFSDNISSNIVYNTGWSRIHSALQYNPSYISSPVYSDINMSFILKEDMVRTNHMTIGPSSLPEGASVDIPIKVRSAMDISIKINGSDFGCSISVISVSDGAVIYNNFINVSSEITIPKTYFYNPETDVTRYGDYIIRLSTDSNYTDYTIEYDELLTREVSVTSNDSTIKKLNIEMSEPISITEIIN